MSQELREFKQFEAIMGWISDYARVMIGESKEFIAARYPQTREEYDDINLAFSVHFDELVYISNVLIFVNECQISYELKSRASELLASMISLASIHPEVIHLFSEYGYFLNFTAYTRLKADMAERCNMVEIAFDRFDSVYKKINWSFFKQITDFIPLIEQGECAGDWVFNKAPKKEGEPTYAPYVKYTDKVYKFLDAVYDFVEKHPSYNLPDAYMNILYDNDIDWCGNSMEDADSTLLDDQCILALIIGVINADRFSDGTIAWFFNKGCILRWLERLVDLEDFILDEENEKLTDKSCNAEQFLLIDAENRNVENRKEKQIRQIQEAMIEHQRKMDTDEEYRKECEKFQSMIMDFGDDEE